MRAKGLLMVIRIATEFDRLVVIFTFIHWQYWFTMTRVMPAGATTSGPPAAAIFRSVVPPCSRRFTHLLAHSWQFEKMEFW